MPILNALVNHGFNIWAVLFNVGLYAQLLKPRWGHYGIAVLVVTGNLLALFHLAKLSMITGI